jgi:hypothetical protein
MIHRVPLLVDRDGDPIADTRGLPGGKAFLFYRTEIFRDRDAMQAYRKVANRAPSRRRFRKEGLLRIATAHNMVTTVGANTYLNATLVSGIASPAWFCSMITGSGAPTFATSDTMASHAGWTEMAGANVTAGTRGSIVWNGAASGGQVSNSSSLISYTVASGQSFTAQGFFVCDNSTIGGTSGNLLSEAVFDQGAQALTAGNIITISITGIIVAG